ncbi:MAG: hypothetical protein HQK72_06120 [Desulfamplus sp.]|nr:hypothetical protein [Desulfamplus sp.]
MVTFHGSDGTFLKIPATKTFQTLEFNASNLQLTISDGKVMLALGSKEITTAKIQL